MATCGPRASFGERRCHIMMQLLITFHWTWFLGFFVNCINNKIGTERWGSRNVGYNSVLAKEREASSAFIFASGGNRDDLDHLLCHLCSAQLLNGESPMSRPLPASMNRSVSLHCPKGFISSALHEKVSRLLLNCELQSHITS